MEPAAATLMKRLPLKIQASPKKEKKRVAVVKVMLVIRYLSSIIILKGSFPYLYFVFLCRKWHNGNRKAARQLFLFTFWKKKQFPIGRLDGAGIWSGKYMRSHERVYLYHPRRLIDVFPRWFFVTCQIVRGCWRWLWADPSGLRGSIVFHQTCWKQVL